MVAGLGCLAVVHVEMVPIVAFAAPYHASAVGEHVAVYAWIVDILVGSLFDERTHRSVFGRHLQNSIDLMSALVVFKRYSFAVGVPLRPVEFILLVKQSGVWNQGLACLHVEDAWHLEAQFIARFGVFLLVQNGLELA